MSEHDTTGQEPPPLDLRAMARAPQNHSVYELAAALHQALDRLSGLEDWEQGYVESVCGYEERARQAESALAAIQAREQRLREAAESLLREMHDEDTEIWLVDKMIERLRSALAAPQEPQPGRVVCPFCDGSGWNRHEPGGGTYGAVCSHCNGSGSAPDFLGDR